MVDIQRQAVRAPLVLRYRPGGYRFAAVGAVAFLTAMSIGCPRSTGQQSSVAQSSDSSAFAAVVNAVLADSAITAADRAAGRAPVVGVDPRPLRAGDIFTKAILDSASSQELAARMTTLRSLRLPADDAQEPAGCAGRSVPSPSDGRRSGCPAVKRFVVAVARPRPGDATMPNAPDSRFSTARVILSAIGPEGTSAEGRDYVLERLPGGWRVVRMKVVGYDF